MRITGIAGKPRAHLSRGVCQRCSIELTIDLDLAMMGLADPL